MPLFSTVSYKQVAAEQACNEFGTGWNVSIVRDGALICTLNAVTWGDNCNDCNTWRLVVWKNGAHEYDAGSHEYDGIEVSTKAGEYYGGHDRCSHLGPFPLCGQWGQVSGKFK